MSYIFPPKKLLLKTFSGENDIKVMNFLGWLCMTVIEARHHQIYFAHLQDLITDIAQNVKLQNSWENMVSKIQVACTKYM